MAVIAAAFLPVAYCRENDKILLRNVNVLTLRKGEFTTHRRVSPIMQLTCTHGCNERNMPDEVQCINVGFDGVDVNWKCEADLPMGAKMTHMNIQCEGYDYPDDPFVLVGSCGATFELEQSRYAYVDDDYNRGYNNHRHHRSISYDYDNNEWSWSSIIMFSVVLFIFWNVFCGGRREEGEARPTFDSGPSPQQTYWSRPRGWGSPFGGGGFWSGLGLGSMLGSAWSRPRARNGWGWGRGSSWGEGPSYYNGNNSYGGYGYGGSGVTHAGRGSANSSPQRRTTSSYGTTTRR